MSSTTTSPHVVLITGANTGIGLETAKALCASAEPYTIILAGRTPSKITEAIQSLHSEFPSTSSTLHPATIDLDSDASISAAYSQLSQSHPRIDTLINNAGASFDRFIITGSLSIRAAWNQTWDTNVSGAHVLTHTFMPLLLRSPHPRLLFLTSGTASLAESFLPGPRYNQSPAKGWPKDPAAFAVSSYRAAKTGLNMLVREWEKVLREDGVKVFAISPGFLATGLGGDVERLRKLGAGEPRVGGEFIRDVVLGKRDAEAGRAIRRDEVQEW